MISYYPSWKYFKEYVGHQYSNGRDLHIYIDVRNACRSLFFEDAILSIYDSMFNSNKLDISVYASFINYIMRIRNFFIHQMQFKNVRLFFFMDRGRTTYHYSISKKYKESRKASMMNIDTKIIDSVYTCINNNWDICHKFLNMLPDVYFIKLQDIESDFIPHYLIKKYFINYDNIMHLIFTTDKDMLQTLTLRPDIYQYAVIKKSDHRLIDSNHILNYLTKRPDEDFSDVNNYFNIIMAYGGDMGDDIAGINRIGYLTAIKHMRVLKDLGYTAEDLKNRILTKTKIKDFPEDKKIRKMVITFNENLDILYDSYRLISFDCLIDFLEISIGEQNNIHNYKLNTIWKSNFFEYIDNILNHKKYNFTYTQFIDVLRETKGVTLNQYNININEVNNYFIQNGGLFKK